MYRNPGTEFIGALSFPHGDSICSAEDGGEACFMVSFPTGFGAPIRDQLLLNALVNDVRERSAPPMRFSLQLAVRITQAPQRDVGLWYAAAIPDFVDGGFLRTVRSGKQLFVQFKIPADRESVLWTTLVVRESGRWLNLWMHTHPLLGFEEQWLISATPRELGLNAGAFQPPRCHGPFVPSAHGLTSDDVRSRIVAHMRASGLKFRCIVTQTAEHVANVAGVEGATRSACRTLRNQGDNPSLARCEASATGAPNALLNAGGGRRARTSSRGQRASSPSSLRCPRASPSTRPRPEFGARRRKRPRRVHTQ